MRRTLRDASVRTEEQMNFHVAVDRRSVLSSHESCASDATVTYADGTHEVTAWQCGWSRLLEPEHRAHLRRGGGVVVVVDVHRAVPATVTRHDAQTLRRRDMASPQGSGSGGHEGDLCAR